LNLKPFEQSQQSLQDFKVSLSSLLRRQLFVTFNHMLIEAISNNFEVLTLRQPKSSHGSQILVDFLCTGTELFQRRSEPGKVIVQLHLLTLRELGIKISKLLNN
jgi:hypothetical protein